MLNPGLRYSLGDDLVLAKSPRFSNNKKCDFKVFGNKFDLVFARSIITHGGPGMVCRLFEQFRDHTEDDAVMLLSYWPNTYLTKARRMFKDKMCMSGDELPLDDWRFVFVMTYSFQRLHSWAEEYGLAAENWLERPLINEQMWLRVTKNNALPRPMRATERPKRRSNSGLHLWSKVIRHRLRPN
jgi:hypothetical protein